MSPSLYGVLSRFASKLQSECRSAPTKADRLILERCGQTAAKVWAFLTGPHVAPADFTALVAKNHGAPSMMDDISRLRVLPGVGRYHLVCVSLNAAHLDHQCVIVIGHSGCADSLQSYIGLYGPTLTTLGRSDNIVSALLHLVRNSRSVWDHAYVDAYDRIANLRIQTSAGEAVYDGARELGAMFPDAPNLRTPSISVVVRLDVVVPN